MRDKVNSQEFCSSVESLARQWFSTRRKILSNHVVNSSNFTDRKLFFNLKYASKVELIKLAIVMWYADEEVHFVLRMDLEEKIKNLPLEDQVIFNILLSSKAEMLIFLLETNLWHTRDFFGNILQNLEQLDRLLIPKVPQNKVKRPARKRGYHDKGSWVLPHEWRPKSGWWYNEQHELLEATRSKLEHTSNFIRGFQR